MRIKNFILALTISTGFALTFAGTGNCASPVNSSADLTKLAAAPAGDLPQVAARIVRESDIRAREATTIAVIKHTALINPGALPAVVGAISQSVPEMAVTASVFAVQQQPNSMDAIIRAAVGGAPSRSGRIVAALCERQPEKFRTIALAANDVSPSSARDILKSIGETIPDLKPFITRNIAGFGIPSVAATLDAAVLSLPKNARLAVASRGALNSDAGTGPSPTRPVNLPPGGGTPPPPTLPPIFGLPQPPPTTPTNTTGGRNYN